MLSVSLQAEFEQRTVRTEASHYQSTVHLFRGNDLACSWGLSRSAIPELANRFLRSLRVIGFKRLGNLNVKRLYYVEPDPISRRQSLNCPVNSPIAFSDVITCLGRTVVRPGRRTPASPLLLSA